MSCDCWKTVVVCMLGSHCVAKETLVSCVLRFYVVFNVQRFVFVCEFGNMLVHFVLFVNCVNRVAGFVWFSRFCCCYSMFFVGLFSGLNLCVVGLVIRIVISCIPASLFRWWQCVQLLSNSRCASFSLRCLFMFSCCKFNA